MDSITMMELAEKLENERRNFENSFKDIESNTSEEKKNELINLENSYRAIETHFEEMDNGSTLTINGFIIDLNNIIITAEDLRGNGIDNLEDLIEASQDLKSKISSFFQKAKIG